MGVKKCMWLALYFCWAESALRKIPAWKCISSVHSWAAQPCVAPWVLRSGSPHCGSSKVYSKDVSVYVKRRASSLIFPLPWRVSLQNSSVNRNCQRLREFATGSPWSQDTQAGSLGPFTAHLASCREGIRSRACLCNQHLSDHWQENPHQIFSCPVMQRNFV